MATIQFLLYDYKDLKTDDERENYIDNLEQFIQECRDAANRGEEIESDAVYDTAVDILRSIKPDSPIFNTTWSSDDASAPLDEDLDKYLMVHPMYSIFTIKDIAQKEFVNFSNLCAERAVPQSEDIAYVELHASTKMNGHGIRFVYKDGKFAKAHTRGRSSNGRDITHALSLILPAEIPAIANDGVVEFRGELLLPYSNMDAAKKYKADIKSAFTGVSAMIRESASDDEYKLLRVVTYAAYNNNYHFDSMLEMYAFIQDTCGLEIPLCKAYRLNTKKTPLTSCVMQIMTEFENLQKTYDYFTDGVVLSLNKMADLEAVGIDRTTRNGNVAMKVGFWKQDMYSSVVDHIEWKEGRSKLTPVAVVEPTLTANGASVQNVPLYAPIHILRLQAYPGNMIHFRFGGEAGVVPCFPDGSLVTD